MYKIGSTSKRKRKLDYDCPGNQVVVSCFDTPKKMAPKQRERRVSVGCHGNKDWERRMEGFEGVAAAKEESGPNPDDESTPVDIDWASESEADSREGQEVASSQQCNKNTRHRKELTTSVCPSKERPCCRSTSAFRGRTFTKPAGSGKTHAVRGGGGGKTPRGDRRAVGRQSTPQDSLEVSISDYDSDTEEESEEFDKITNDHHVVQTSSSLSPVIASLTPSRSPSPQSDAAANRSKVSDWVKCLQWQDTTPEKQNDAVEESNVADSTKKKPKYIRHGLADQLQRLIAREKSAMAFWNHKLITARTAGTAATPVTTATTVTAVTAATAITAVTTTASTLTSAPTTVVAAMTTATAASTLTSAMTATTSDTTTAAGTDVQASRMLCVRVEGVRRESSLLIAECSYLPSLSVPKDHDSVVVLFSGSSKVTPGSGVNIHTPWQSLDTGGRRVILCSHFHEVFPLETPVVTQHSPSSTLLALWRCPCQKDRSLDPPDCPANLFPCSTTTTDKSITGDNHNCLSHAPAFVSSTHTDHPHRLVAVSGTETVSLCGPSLSILDSVEKQGGGTTASVGFTATIQRVFTHCTRSGQGAVDTEATAMAWSLLVQDVYGAVCHIEVTDRLTDRVPWTEMLHSGEGKVYTFTGLRLVRRTSRARCAGLFSVIDAIWTATAMSRREDVSQDSSLGSEPVMFSEPPGFCYHLAAVCPQSGCMLSPPQTPPLYTPISHTPLAYLAQFQGRVTLLARVLCHRNDISSPSIDSIRSAIYVTDCSRRESGERWESGYVCVLVKQTCLPPCPWLTTGSGVVVFKDLLSHQPGRYYFDPYSRIFNATREDTLTRFSLATDDVTAVAMATFSPPPMALGAHVYDLVEVKGHLTSVDESTAFSWLECDVCHSDKLVAEPDSSGLLRCNDCKKSVECPISRINLDVFVSCLHPCDVSVKVKLLQPTIEMLLPKHKDDEGYDVENILRRVVGPLTCVVVSTTKRKDSYQFVLQEVLTMRHQVM